MSSGLDITKAVKPPRAVFVNYPMGHQTGKPHEPELQRSIIRDAFAALPTMDTPGSIVTLPYVWDEDDPNWEDRQYRPGYLAEYTRTAPVG
jgi:hypothetical protein